MIVFRKDKNKLGKEAYFNDNYFRKRIWDRDTVVARPDEKYIKEYKAFLAKAYKESLQKQLNVSGPMIYGGYKSLTYPERLARKEAGKNFQTRSIQVRSKLKGLGFATGKLLQGIKTKASVYIDYMPDKGRTELVYTIFSDYEKYGDYIASGRRAGNISPFILVRWIIQKMSNGVMSVDKGNKKNKYKAVVSFAFAIANRAKKANKPPVIPDWSNMNVNKKLYEEFNKRNRTEGARIRRNMKNNVLSKMKRRNGK